MGIATPLIWILDADMTRLKASAAGGFVASFMIASSQRPPIGSNAFRSIS